jgi:hypothetical protein
LREKINGNWPTVAMIVSAASMIVSTIVGLTVLFGNPLNAASREDVKEEVQEVKGDIENRLGRMEGRLIQQIDKVHRGLDTHTNSGDHDK